MPDLGQPSSSPKPGGSGMPELTMERRLLLAFALTALVFIGSNFLFRPQPPRSVKQTAPVAPVTQAKAPAPAATIGVPAVTGATTESQYRTERIVTDLYDIQFANRGGVVKSWLLRRFTDNKGQPLQLINELARPKVYYPFTVELERAGATVELNQALYTMRRTPDGLGLDLEFSDGRTTARKSFRFRKDSYLVDVASEVTVNGTGMPHALLWRGGFGDPFAASATTYQYTTRFDPAAGKLVKYQEGDAKGGTTSYTGNFPFAGIEDSYFAAMALPRAGQPIELRTYRDEVPSPVDPNKDIAHVGVGWGGDARNQFALFVGPKDTDLLRRVDPRLEQLIDWGFFGFLARPLFLSLNWVNDRYVHNFGWSIVLVTVIINLLLVPLKFSSIKSMKKMSLVQPEIQRIQAKYKSLALTDPKRQNMNEEIMAVYKKHGVSPTGGCLPLLLQMPFFLAFLTVLQVAIELRGARWLWVTDLSQPETLAVRILPILLVATGFLQQKMTPSATADPQQQRIMLLMPLMLGFLFYYSSSGLVLYWLTGNIVGIAQQLVFNRLGLSASPGPAGTAVVDVKPATATPPVRKKGTRV